MQRSNKSRTAMKALLMIFCISLASAFYEGTPFSWGWSTKNNLPTLEGNTIGLLQGIKGIVFLAYLGLVTSIIVIFIKKRRIILYSQSLKQEHSALCDELEGRRALCSELTLQANQKARELTSTTLSMIQKHNVLASINTELKSLSPLFYETPLTDTLIGKRFKTIAEATITDNRNYWEDFLSHFQLLYPNYLSNIKTSGNEITEKELKLAALLRLGLDTKKIAGLLNLSPVSIKVFRHRLRKKLELPEDVNLYNYLSHFDNQTN